MVDKLRGGVLQDNEETLFKDRFSKIGSWTTGDFIDSTLLELQSNGKLGIIKSRLYRKHLGEFELALSQIRRGQTNITDFQKAIELEIIPRVQRDFVNGENVLLSPFNELTKDIELQRYITRRFILFNPTTVC